MTVEYAHTHEGKTSLVNFMHLKGFQLLLQMSSKDYVFVNKFFFESKYWTVKAVVCSTTSFLACFLCTNRPVSPKPTAMNQKTPILVLWSWNLGITMQIHLICCVSFVAKCTTILSSGQFFAEPLQPLFHHILPKRLVSVFEEPNKLSSFHLQTIYSWVNLMICAHLERCWARRPIWTSGPEWKKVILEGDHLFAQLGINVCSQLQTDNWNSSCCHL